MKPQPRFETNEELEAAARHAERRKCQAIAELVRKLGQKHRFEQARYGSAHSRARMIDANKPKEKW
jgi:hypothetical protein